MRNRNTMMASADHLKAHQRAIIRDHYGLNRPVTETEREAEIASLNRKRNAGSLDDMSERLAARLFVI